jgi:hypothetical protein
MAGPRRSSTLEELTDEQVWCHAFGHNWDDPPVEETQLRVGVVVQLRQDHRCDNGCGCTKGHYVHPPSGRRWGWKRAAGEGYGIDGGYTREDFVKEWLHRAATERAVKPIPLPYQRRRRGRQA